MMDVLNNTTEFNSIQISLVAQEVNSVTELATKSMNRKKLRCGFADKISLKLQKSRPGKVMINFLKCCVGSRSKKTLKSDLMNACIRTGHSLNRKVRN
jgi:hypothetical protein